MVTTGDQGKKRRFCFVLRERLELISRSFNFLNGRDGEWLHFSQQPASQNASVGR